MFGRRGLHNNDDMRAPAGRSLDGRDDQGQPASKHPAASEHGSSGRSAVTCSGASWWLLQAFSKLEASLYTLDTLPLPRGPRRQSAVYPFSLHCRLHTTVSTLPLHSAYRNPPPPAIRDSRKSPVFLSYHTPARLQLAGACTTASFLLRESVPIRPQPVTPTHHQAYTLLQHTTPTATRLLALRLII